MIDPSTNTMYVATESKENGYFLPATARNRHHHRRGKIIRSGPCIITATVPGTADGSTTVTFDPLMHLSRPGLLLLNGSVYIAYSSNCDNTPYHGWVFSYNAATFAQTGVYITATTQMAAWAASGCLVTESRGIQSGNIYIPSGNGDFDTVNIPAIETGDTLFKLNQRGNLLPMSWITSRPPIRTASTALTWIWVRAAWLYCPTASAPLPIRI